MPIEINTKVSVGESFGRRLGNITLEDAKFFGRPNFSGEEDQFKDDRRKFTVLIPNEVADQLREIGWNVKTTFPKPEQLENDPEMQPVSHLKVMVDSTGDVYLRLGEDIEHLNERTMGALDRSRIEYMDMEIRAWEWDPKEKPGEYSARLVTLVATLRPNIMQQKYGAI